MDSMKGAPAETMPVNLDPIQTGSVLRLALEGKFKKDSNPLLIADSNPTVLLDGFSSLNEDTQVRRKKIRYSSSVAAGTRLPVLPPRPSLHRVSRPSLHHCNTSWLLMEIDRLLKIKRNNGTYYSTQPHFEYNFNIKIC